MSLPDSSSDSETDPTHPASTPENKTGSGGGGGSRKEDNNNNNRDAIVHSLGEALAGVTIGSAEKFTSPAAVSSAASTPFALTSQTETDGWGNFSAESTAFTSSSGQSGASSTPRGGGGASSAVAMQSEGLDLFLSHSSGSQALGDNVFRYSQQNLPALGREEEAFRLAGGQILAPGPSTSSSTNAPPQSSSFTESRRRTESPSCSVTGTTTSSRSVSPYTNSSGDVGSGSRIIHAYQRYESASTTSNNNDLGLQVIGRSSNQPSFAEDDRSSSGYNSLSHGHGSHPSLATLDSNAVASHRSPYARDHRIATFNKGSSPQIISSNSNSPFDNHYQQQQQHHQAPPTSYALQGGDMMLSPQHHLQQPVPTPTSSSSNNAATTTAQPQVLYMAVPTPDGRGQVLQPVQMVQLPGKPYHFVASNGATPPQVVAQPSSATDNNNMMVLPPLPNHTNVGMGVDIPPSPSLQQGGVGGGAMENRNRVANYAMDTSASRPYGIDVLSDFSTPRGGGGGGGDNDYGLTTASTNSGGSGAQYQVDAAISALYASPQRPPLDALLGEVRRLSRDQVGCRLVQQALDEEGPMAATLILNEGLPFWAEAMVDPFGNYLFQKILEKVTPAERVMLVKSVSSRLVNASLNIHGTRSVQKVVEMCSQDEQDAGQNDVDGGEAKETAADILTSALVPAAARLCIDSHGNHVIQRILLKLGPKHTRFVFDAVAASVGDVARHRHGCCVIQRCLDSPPNEARAHLVRRIVEKSLELMQDAYGNYVVQYVLDVCSDEDVHAVCESVAGKINLLAIQKFSSNVMEKCLERCSDRVKELYLQEMSDPDRIRELMMDPFGNYVIQRALSVATHAQAIQLVEAMRPHLIATQTSGPHGQRNGGVRNTAGGRRIIAKICRRFPNFRLSPIDSEDELYDANQGNQHHHHQQQLRHPHHHLHHPGATAAMSSGVGGYGTNPFTAAAYSSTSVVGSSLTAAASAHHSHLSYAADPRLGSHGHVPVQQQQPQQSYYSMGSATPYYDQYSGAGLGGFPGM